MFPAQTFLQSRGSYNDLRLGKAARGINVTLITILHTGPWPIIRGACTSKGAIKANILSSTTVNWTVDLITRIWSVGGCNFRGWVQPCLELSEGQSDGEEGGGGGDPEGEIYSTLPMSPDITTPSHLLPCCPVQTCHSHCSRWRWRKWGGQEQFFYPSIPHLLLHWHNLII